MEKKALVLANGKPPRKRLLLALLRDSEMFACADGGANTAARLGVEPRLIIGDLDSIRPGTVRKFSHVTTRRIVDQNRTDLEKSIGYLLRRGYHDICVTGALGGRLDHCVGNLAALVKFGHKTRIRIVEDGEEIFYVGSELKTDLPVGATVSLIPLSRCEGVVTKGLQWNLQNEALELGLRESTSNMVTVSPLRIQVRRGHLLLYRLTSPSTQSTSLRGAF